MGELLAWWWTGNVILILMVIPFVIVLANRLVRRAREIRRYSADVVEHGLAVSGNLDPIAEDLGRTRQLVARARQGVEQYWSAASRLI